MADVRVYICACCWAAKEMGLHTAANSDNGVVLWEGRVTLLTHTSVCGCITQSLSLVSIEA